MTDQKEPTKFCKDCANFRGPDLCFLRMKTNVINGEQSPEYGICGFQRSDSGQCGHDAKRFIAIDASKPLAHRSYIGFVLREWFFGK